MANGHSCKEIKMRSGTEKKPLPADPDPVPFVIDKRAHFSLEFHRKEIGNIQNGFRPEKGGSPRDLHAERGCPWTPTGRINPALLSPVRRAGGFLTESRFSELRKEKNR